MISRTYPLTEYAKIVGPSENLLLFISSIINGVEDTVADANFSPAPNLPVAFVGNYNEIRS